MKWSWFGRAVLALTSAVSLGLSMTACGGGTIAYLWAVGQQYNQIVGYQVDDFTGNLTVVPGQPFSSGGTNPVTLLVRSGGRFLYVINQGTGYSSTSNGTGDGIDVYAIGGQGSLTFEQHYETQGFGHLWATFDSTGGFLYVLDRYSPTYQPDSTKPSYDPNGIITTFSSDATTGRLELVQQTASTQPGQTSPNYLEVGDTPLRMAAAGSCLFTLNSAAQNITTYSTTNGQLGTVTTGVYPVGSVSATSIANGNGQYLFVTDNMKGNGPGQIFNFNVGTGCALTPFSAGPVTANDATATNPTNVFVSTSSKYVYVLNGSSSSTATNSRGSSVTAYVIISGQLQELPGSPFSTGSGPECMVEDPTSKYLYSASFNDGVITGYLYSDTTGQIANLSRGSTFKTSTLGLTCLALSGAV